MPSTPHGYPYPTPADPVSLGAAAIQALAEAVEKRLATLSGVPPASPVDGQLWYQPVSSGGLWLFRYNAAASNHKWEFVGGTRAAVYFPTAQPIGSAGVWVDGAPSIVLPRLGSYLADIGAVVLNNAQAQTQLGIDVGGVTVAGTSAAATVAAEWGITRTALPFTTAAADTLVQLSFFVGVAGQQFRDRYLAITPVMVS